MPAHENKGENRGKKNLKGGGPKAVNGSSRHPAAATRGSLRRKCLAKNRGGGSAKREKLPE